MTNGDRFLEQKLIAITTRLNDLLKENSSEFSGDKMGDDNQLSLFE